MTVRKTHFEKNSGKRRKCCYPAFPPFPIMFSILPNSYYLNYSVTCILSSTNTFNSGLSEMFSFGKEVMLHQIFMFYYR